MSQSQVGESSLIIFRRFLPLYLGILVGPLNATGAFNMIPTFSEEFDVPISIAGLAITAYTLPLVISQIFSGMVAEALGTTRTLVMGFLIFAVAGLAVAIAPNYLSFLASRAIQGLGGGLILPLALVMAAENAPASRMAMVVGTVQSAFTVGTALGPGVGGIFTDQIHWRGFFLFTAGGGAISALAIALAYSNVPSETTSQHPLRTLQKAISIPGVRAVSLIGFLLFFSSVGTFIFIAIWLQTSGMAGPTSTGLLLSLAGIAGIIVSPIAGYLGDRLDIARAVMVGIMLSLLAQVGFFAFPNIIWLYPFLLLATGTGNAFTTTNVGALSLSLWPNFRRAVSGVVNGSRFLGLALAPILLAPVYEAASIRGVLLVTGAGFLLALILLRQVKKD
jgi:predicted MFS family arabinose efflux permease